MVEQEAVVLQSKLQTVESENEKLLTENKRLLLLTNRTTKKSNTDLSTSETNGDKNSSKETEASLLTANKKITELTEAETQQKKEIETLKQQLSTVSLAFKNV